MIFANGWICPGKSSANAQKVYDVVAAADDPIKKGKEILYLTKNKGAFVKMCPGTRHYTCCDYGILHIGTYCDMDCAYCIMQTYFHPPILQYFVNHEDLLNELGQLFNRPNISRIGTGEYTDSLIWEKWTHLSSLLVNRFAGQDKAVLEIKSKTTAVESLEGSLSPAQNHRFLVPEHVPYHCNGRAVNGHSVRAIARCCPV